MEYTKNGAIHLRGKLHQLLHQSRATNRVVDVGDEVAYAVDDDKLRFLAHDGLIDKLFAFFES